MKFYIHFSWFFLAAGLLVGQVLTGTLDSSHSSDSSGSSDSSNSSGGNKANNDFLKNLNCIATSENQEMCDEFLKDCNQKFPDKVIRAYYKCLCTVMGGDIGDCSSGDQLYQSEDMRAELNKCITGSVDFDDMSDAEKEQVHEADECTKKLADEVDCS